MSNFKTVQQTVQCASWLTEVANTEGLHGVRVGVKIGAREQIFSFLFLFGCCYSFIF